MVIIVARFQDFGTYPNRKQPLNIRVNNKTTDFGRNFRAVFVILSNPGAFRLGRFLIIF